jgi:hypothetical protein
MATFTSTRAGNWSASATWGGSGPPGAGDLAVVAVVQSAVSAANNGSGLIRLTVGSTSNWTTGQYAYVSGVTGTTEANGLWVVTVVDGTHLDLQSSTFTNAYVSGGNANCVVAVDTNTTVGATTSVGIGVTINGTSINQMGVLIVPSGVTLTLRGFDTTTHCMMKILQYGLFAPQPGSTIKGGVPSDFASLIWNLGRFEAIGTSGSHITITTENGGTWSLAGSETSKAYGAYDGSGLTLLNGTSYAGNIMTAAFAQGQISNSGGTALGSPLNFATDVSVSASGYTLTTARGSLAAIVAAADYYFDNDMGILYVAISGAIGSVQTISCTYKKLDRTAANWRGWGIYSAGAQAGCTCLINYCDFSYMGASGSGYVPANQNYRIAAPVNLLGHQTPTVAANRNGYVKNCTFNGCFRYVLLANNSGANGDPILIQSNTCNEGSGGGTWEGIGAYASNAQTYITIDSNAFNTRNVGISFAGISTATPSTLNADNTNICITNNTGVVGINFLAAAGATTFPALNWIDTAVPGTPDLYVAGNTIRGVGENGGVLDSRFVLVSGTSGHPAIIENNHFHHCHRLGHNQGSYVTWRKNRLGMSYHHGFTGASVDDTYVTDIKYENNLFYCDRTATTQSTSAAISLGYNHRVTVNNLTIVGNTFDGWKNGCLDFNDVGDTSGPTLATNIVIADNIISNGAYAFAKYTSAANPCNLHVLECDYNVVYNQATGFSNGLTGTKSTGFYQGSNKYNRLTGANRNINGVALFDATYTTAQTGRSLVYTVTSLGVTHTLSWGGGATQSLIYDSGISAGVGLRTLACVGKSTWAANNNSIRTKWLWVVSGTGAGQARAITWVSANVAYSVSAINNGQSGYAVGDFLTYGGTPDTPGAKIVLKVTSVSAGAITGLKIVSGGGYASTPTNPVTLARITGSGAAGVTASFNFAPGLLLSPDLTTDLDSTSVFAIHESMVTCADSGGTDTVKCGFYLPDPANWQTAVQIPSTTQTDSNITVSVNKSPTTNPNFNGSGLSNVASDYQWASGSAKDAGTSDNAPSTDYFGTARPQGSAIDIGFFEILATGGCSPVSSGLVDGRFVL